MFKNYTRDDCHKIKCPRNVSKMTMLVKYVPEVDIREIYARIKEAYVLPVRYAHG